MLGPFFIISSSIEICPVCCKKNNKKIYKKSWNYAQVQEWRGVKLSPESYGWKLCSGRYMPLQGFEDICPKVIASLLSCGCRKNCSTLLCSCKKSGVKCTEICGCLEDDCENHDNDFGSYSCVDTDSDSDMDVEDFEFPIGCKVWFKFTNFSKNCYIDFISF